MNGTLAIKTGVGSKVIAAITRTLVAVTLAAGLVVGNSGTAQAAIPNAYLFCYEGSEMFTIDLPIDVSARMSYFAFRVDGGAWAYTSWYLTDWGRSWVDGGGYWVALPLGGGPGSAKVGGNRLVEAFEARYNAATKTSYWISLGSCWTSSFFGNPIRIH